MRSAVTRMLVVGEEVAVVWADGHESYYPGVDLRKACTCATCKGEQHLFGRATFPALAPLATEAFRPVQVRLVGNYGLQVIWGDGHSHGIYDLADLRAACRCAECRAGAGPAAG